MNLSKLHSVVLVGIGIGLGATTSMLLHIDTAQATPLTVPPFNLSTFQATTIRIDSHRPMYTTGVFNPTLSTDFPEDVTEKGLVVINRASNSPLKDALQLRDVLLSIDTILVEKHPQSL